MSCPPCSDICTAEGALSVSRSFRICSAAVASHAGPGELGKTNLSALLRSFEQKEEVGGRTQIWQNGSEVHSFPLICVSVLVRTMPSVI